MADKQSTCNVEIFVRIRPVDRPSKNVTMDPQVGEINFKIPREVSAGYINNQREDYKFLFNGILEAESKQAKVFETVCRPAVDVFLSGVNSTIFAYGQTGSGKTFTITGGPERYEDRGLIPRSISYIFKSFTSRSEYVHTVHISYMEIYNSQAYDLLDPSREEWCMCSVASEEDALNLLFLGDTNRMIAETPMNMASSRSHCVFSLHLEARCAGEAVVRRSKLNLVDLAGSERAAKSGIDGTALSEAKYINASLHYLEQVILALQERAMGLQRPHIPYRNSLMTMVLRDSLGGNCKTRMIANINIAAPFLDESISTCRFAQRVAMISNKVSVNEETDPRIVIQQLKQEVRDLKAELQLLQGGEEQRGPITAEERQRLKRDVEAFVSSPDPEGSLPLRASMLEMREVLSVFKEVCLAYKAAQGSQATTRPYTPGYSGTPAVELKGVQALQDEVQKLRLQVQQRDNEITILVSMLKKHAPPSMLGANAGSVSANAGSVSHDTPPPSKTQKLAQMEMLPSNNASAGGLRRAATCNGQPETCSASGQGEAVNLQASKAAGGSGEVLLDVSVLQDRNRAFELFRKSYRRNAAIENSTADLKEKYARAKALGAYANSLKQKLCATKAALERRRLSQAASDIANSGPSTAAAECVDTEEAALLAQIEELKTEYQGSIDELRSLKSAIEHLQLTLQQSRTRIQADFERWYAVMLQQRGEPLATGARTTASVTTEVHNGHTTEAGNEGSVHREHQSASPNSFSERLEQVQSCQHAGRLAAIHSAQEKVGTSQASVAAEGSGIDCKLQHGEHGSTASGSGFTRASAVSATINKSSVLYPEEVLKAAAPHLTGDAAADADILGFYAARHKLVGGGT